MDVALLYKQLLISLGVKLAFTCLIIPTVADTSAVEYEVPSTPPLVYELPDSVDTIPVAGATIFTHEP